MKRTLSILILLFLALTLMVSQAFASNSSFKPKQTPGPNETPEVESQEVEQPDKPDAKENKPEKVNHPGKKYNFKGEVTSFNGTTLVMNDKKGGSVTVTVDGNTEIKITGPNADTAKIEATSVVMVQAVKQDNGYLALRVHLMPNKGQKVHRVGVVTQYGNGTITVKDAKGETTFTLAQEVKILPAERAGDLQDGARVTVISNSDPANPELTAQGVVVHPTK